MNQIKAATTGKIHLQCNKGSREMKYEKEYDTGAGPVHITLGADGPRVHREAGSFVMDKVGFYNLESEIVVFERATPNLDCGEASGAQIRHLLCFEGTTVKSRKFARPGTARAVEVECNMDFAYPSGARSINIVTDGNKTVVEQREQNVRFGMRCDRIVERVIDVTNASFLLGIVTRRSFDVTSTYIDRVMYNPEVGIHTLQDLVFRIRQHYDFEDQNRWSELNT